MGCAASKIDNEDVVRRCKERRRLMKEAVHARHHLAGAHADYCRSLRLTGAALSTFAANEPLSVSDNTPAVFLHSNKPAREPYAPPPFPKRESHDPSPPPPPPFPPSPSSTSTATTPPPKLPHILSAASIPRVNGTRRRARPKPAMKLPHILSESSPNSSPRSMASNFTNPNTNTNPYYNAYPTAYSTYSSTPSQASSVWNWDNFYPPSPPDSEYFNQKEMMMKKDKRHGLYHQNPSGSDFDEDDNETSASEYDFFHRNPPKGSFKTKSQMDNSSLKHVESRASLDGGGETEREEVQCSEWGDHDHDHYSSSSSSSSEDEENGIHGEGLEEDGEVNSEIGTRSNYRSARAGSVAGESVKVGLKPGFGKLEEKVEDEVESSSTISYGNTSNVEKDMLKMVVRHKDLKEIVDAVRENFEMAAKAGDQVSEILEIGRAQLDRSFRRLKKTVYHSSSVLSNLSSTWTSKPPLAVKYRLDAAALNDQGGPKSLCSTLDSLLAWEKKLYEEVKAREGVKIAHEKKLSVLQSQEYKAEDETKIDKTKASIKKLQSLIIVTSQAVSTTSTAILGLRDSDLVPQLVELCHGFMYMWRSMHEYHEIQNNIVQQVRGLVNQATKGELTSELHRQATRDLESAVSAWHSSFCRLMKFHRDFVCSIHGWFKLTLLPVDNDNTSGNWETSDVGAFCDEWKSALDRVPDTVASEAIKSFVNVVHVISVKQTEELKIKKRTEAASKELERKASSLRSIEKKYYHSYSMVGLGLPDSGPENGQVLDARDPLAEKKVELASCQRRVEDEMLKHSKAVEVTRAMTLNNLQTGLPGVFQALTSFSSLFVEVLETVCIRSYAIK